MKDILVVVDMQNDFITGPLGTPEAEQIVHNVANKVKEYRMAYRPVVFTRDTHYSSLYSSSYEGSRLPVKHCIYGTDGWHVHHDIAKESPLDCFYINKNNFGKLHWDDVIPQGIKSIEIVGLCTDICVITNALLIHTQFPETPIFVDASCCAGTTPERHKEALDVMRSCQIEVENDD